MVGLAVLFLILWVLGFIVFKVAAVAIHLLIVIAVILFIMGIVRRST